MNRLHTKEPVGRKNNLRSIHCPLFVKAAVVIFGFFLTGCETIIIESQNIETTLPTNPCGNPQVQIGVNCTDALMKVQGVESWVSFIGNGTDITIITSEAVQLTVYSGDCTNPVQLATGNTSLTFSSTVPQQVYYLKFSEFGVERFNVKLCSATQPSSCQTAQPLPNGTFVFGGLQGVATGTPPPACGYTPTGNGVWYQFTGDGQVNNILLLQHPFGMSLFNFVMGNINQRFSVYTGSCNGTLTCVTSGSGILPVELATTQGVEYYVYVDEASGDENFSFCISRSSQCSDLIQSVELARCGDFAGRGAHITTANGQEAQYIVLRVLDIGSTTRSAYWGMISTGPNMLKPQIFDTDVFYLPNAEYHILFAYTGASPLSGGCWDLKVVRVDEDAPSDTWPPQAFCKDTVRVPIFFDIPLTVDPQLFSDGSFDNCPLQYTLSQNVFDCSDIGYHSLTLTVSDFNGHSSQCQTVVHVVDAVAPQISCPGNQTLALGENCTAYLPDYRGLATSNDNCGAPVLTQSPAPNTLVSDAGELTVTLTATDAGGISRQCSFIVNKVDQSAPLIACPDVQTLMLGDNCSAPLPDYRNLAMASDNCDTPTLTQSPAPGTIVSNVGSMSIVLTASDERGNMAECTLTINKIDNTPPTIVCPTPQTLLLDDACAAILPDYRGLANASDNCTLQSLSQSPLPGTGVSDAGEMTVTITAMDANGNTNACSFAVAKIDPIPPAADCFNQTLTFNGEESFTLDADALVDADDNCGIANIELSPAVITCAQLGSIVPVTATITDESGNSVTCTSQITVTGLPCGWSQNPDGVNCENGNSIAYNPATQIFSATSTNCYYANPFTADESAFAQYRLCGNGSITAQVTGISGSAPGWAGVVMREDNTGGAKKAQLMTNLSSAVSRREFRTTTGGQAYPQQFPTQNRYWLRLVRSGNQFSMYVSSNGQAWSIIGVQHIVMNACIEVGLVVSNYTANSTVTATFANVSIAVGNNNLATAPSGLAQTAPMPLDFSVFPNPTSGEINVDLIAYANRPVRIELYDAQGKTLKVAEIEAAETASQRFDLSAYQNGIYLIRAKSEGLPDATKRVVIQR